MAHRCAVVAVPRHRGHRGDAGACRRAGVDQRPVPHRVRLPKCRRGCRRICASRGTSPRRAVPWAQAGEPEATFYRDLADATGVRTMRSVWADVHPQTRHGVVITEDVIAAGGEFLDALTPYSVDQVASTLGELARLHAFAWESPARVDTSWLTPRIAGTMQSARRARDPRQLRRTERCPRPSGDARPAAAHRRGPRCWPRVSPARAGP